MTDSDWIWDWSAWSRVALGFGIWASLRALYSFLHVIADWQLERVRRRRPMVRWVACHKPTRRYAVLEAGTWYAARERAKVLFHSDGHPELDVTLESEMTKTLLDHIRSTWTEVKEES